MPAKKTVYPKGRAWLELDMGNLRHNAAVLRGLLPHGCKLMPAVKADAYGHGAIPVTRELSRLGVRDFCVATAGEGAVLRRYVRGTILVLGCTPPEDFPLLRRYHLTQTVVDYAYAQRLNEYGRPVRVHVGIDTGMHRLGERCENLDRLEQLFRMKHLRIEGAFTHLCAVENDAFTMAQNEVFHTTIEALRQRGLVCPKVHLLNSGGLLAHPEFGGDYARVGIALYGVFSTRADRNICKADLRPVLSLRTRVASVKDLHAGESAGYDLAFTAHGERRIAILTIGYADGLPRSLSCGKGQVLLHGHAAPIISRVCMDQTLVDVTEIPAVRAGDIATVIGADGETAIRAEDAATQADTITNELLSRLGARLERVIRP